MEQSQEYLKREFMHYISDTLALLGAEPEFVKKIQAFEEMPLTEDLIKDLKNYNVDQVDKVKTRLVLCHSAGVKVKK